MYEKFAGKIKPYKTFMCVNLKIKYKKIRNSKVSDKSQNITESSKNIFMCLTNMNNFEHKFSTHPLAYTLLRSLKSVGKYENNS